MKHEPAIVVGFPVGQISKAVGLYQSLLQRSLEHFFPEGVLEPGSDRSFIHWQGSPNQSNFRFAEEPDGFGVEIEWFRTTYRFMPGSPKPFLPAERRLIEKVVQVLDTRFRAMFDLAAANRPELFHYAAEDYIVAEWLDPPNLHRIPMALDTLRVSALSTYENRRVSTGALLLGTSRDPAEPLRSPTQGAPQYDVRLTAVKRFHRICDGLRTLFLVDRHGALTSAIDIQQWADEVQGSEPLQCPCPRAYVNHARATRSGRHICLILTPAQEIKVFAEGTLAFTFTDARWRLLDIPNKFTAWSQAVGKTQPPDLAARIFQAALNLSEERNGALIVVLRDPAQSLPRLIAPSDRIGMADDDPADHPDAGPLSPRIVKPALHHLVWGKHLGEIEPSILEALAGVDGAIVTDLEGRLLSFGAILRIPPDTVLPARAVEGARTTAALVASFHGPVLKVSEDGVVTMYLSGRRIWEI